MALPPLLFHYTSRAAALEGILPSAQLRFGRLPRTNDPREFQPLEFVADNWAIDSDGPILDEVQERTERASRLLRDSVHLLCLTESSLEPAAVAPVGLIGDGATRPRMWAQYADNHAGICLGFDRSRLIDLVQRQFGGREDVQVLDGAVRYVDRLDAAPIPPAALFFTKGWDWSTETEYRFLLRGNTREEEFIEISDALTLVVVGPRFPQVDAPMVESFCAALGARALRLRWPYALPSMSWLKTY